MSSINIREIEMFRAVMLEGSISAAARRLYVSQPSISKYIGNLESRLGLPLFVRSGGRLLPTPEARSFFDQIDRFFHGLSDLELFMKELGEHKQGSLVVAGLPLLSMTVLPDTIARFVRDRPDFSINLQTRGSAGIIEWVAARQVDLGVALDLAHLQDVDIDVEPLAELELFCALPPGHEFESKTEIRPLDLEGQNLISFSHNDRSQFQFDALLDRHKVNPRRRIHVFWSSVAMQLVMRGVGIAMVDQITARFTPGGVDRLRRFRPRQTFSLNLLWPKHWPASEAAKEFASELRRTLDLPCEV
jgi:DNA-binding transcriptional LysR family regulator